MLDKRIRFYILLTLICIVGCLYLSYVFGYENPDIFQSPQFKNIAISSSSIMVTCCNPFFCAMDGEWVAKPNVDFQNLSKIQYLNSQLRLKKGWPLNLYYQNLRCGKYFPLARMIRRNNTQYPYYDIPSQCDIRSMTPCCNGDYGWCGAGDLFCNCANCLDYRRVLFSELATWFPKGNCLYNRLNSREACMYLAQRFSSIIFIGDSLVRHTFSALLMHLTNDYTYGALKTTISARWKNFCGGESQFVDSSCHVQLATQWEDITKNNRYCQNDNVYRVPMSFVQAFSAQHKDLAAQEIKKALQGVRPLIFLGIGIHDNFNARKVIDSYLEPLLKIVRESGRYNPLVIWLNTHAAGLLKPLMFQSTQGNENILKFNNLLQEYCRRNNILVFDAYNMTKDVHSFDGTHYGSAINLLKIDLLLHALMGIT